MSAEVWFDDREDADAFLAGLDCGADVHRVGFAGEEDDEDHAWVVVLPAVSPAVLACAESRGGWVPEAGRQEDPGTALPELPTAPRRIKQASDQPGGDAAGTRPGAV